MWNILRRYLHLYFKLWPWLLAYCVKWTHTTQLTSPISATWQYAGWILHMNLHSYSPSHQRVFCGLVVTNWSAKCECVKFDFPWQTWIFFFLPDSWQDNKTFFEDLVFQQEKIQICTFTFEVNFLAFSASMVVPTSVHDIGITLWRKVTFVPGANKSPGMIPLSWRRSLSFVAIPDIGSMLTWDKENFFSVRIEIQDRLFKQLTEVSAYFYQFLYSSADILTFCICFLSIGQLQTIKDVTLDSNRNQI